MTKIPKTYAKKTDWRQVLEGERLGGAQALGPQLYVHEHDPIAPTISAIRNDAKRIRKPFGGLWTSTYNAEYGSDWIRWCVAYRYTDPFESHWTVLLVPQKGARGNRRFTRRSREALGAVSTNTAAASKY
jgi:hypothetical protein